MSAAALSRDFRSLSGQPPTDPDVQSALSDFLTYTEHFPANLTRSLALIEGLRGRTEERIESIHTNATNWSIFPSLAGDDERRIDPVKLRRAISYALEDAETASRMAVEEAARLDDTCRREAKRLDIVTDKLKAMPLPPSRDPTPEQQALTSPNLKRERRLSVRADGGRVEKVSRKLQDKAATKLRGRRVMVPGEVLPPPDPSAPLESISDWTSPRASPPVLGEPFVPEKERKTAAAAAPRQRSRTPKPLKLDGDRKAQRIRGQRAPGQPGTNAHSSVAGISTSNALLALTQPPEGAVKGSKWLPWLKLTEWEMAKLRKRMKKNAIWVPSATMVRRELKNLGRGVGGKEAARREAKETGGEFVDEHHEGDPTNFFVSGDESAQPNMALSEAQYDGAVVDGDDDDQELINRGMRLNEAKKLKRQRLLEEQAIQAQIAREQGIDAPTGDVKDGKKRRRETTPTADPSAGAGALSPTDTPDPLSKTGPTVKKLKITAPPNFGTSKVPLAPAGPSSSPKSAVSRSRREATPSATSRRAALILKRGKAVSEEPPNRRGGLRRTSNASLPNGSTLTSPIRGSHASAAGGNRPARRSRRPAPVILTSADEEGAKVGVSKRKAAPRKRGAAAAAAAAASSSSSSKTSSDSSAAAAAALAFDPLSPEEEIDPDEPRYCLCDGISWGTMIGCDNEDCEKEWFHLSCVDLTDLPPRRTKWYCPDCRKKMKLAPGSNGLIGSSRASR